VIVSADCAGGQGRRHGGYRPGSSSQLKFEGLTPTDPAEPRAQLRRRSFALKPTAQLRPSATASPMANRPANRTSRSGSTRASRAWYWGSRC